VDRFSFFERLPRNEPGATTFTSAYLTYVQLNRTDRVLDIRSGCGDRAVWVARSRGCYVVAVDRDPRYCLRSHQLGQDSGTNDQLIAVCAQYNALPFDDESFSLVVAEWAATEFGLGPSLKLWRRLVPIGGFIALSYPGVVNRDAPAEVRDPIESRMAQPMQCLADYQATARDSGYEIVYQAPLEHALWDNFYTEAMRRAWSLQGRHALTQSDVTSVSNPVAQSVLNEARWYRQVGRGRVFLQSMLLRRTR